MPQARRPALVPPCTHQAAVGMEGMAAGGGGGGESLQLIISRYGLYMMQQKLLIAVLSEQSVYPSVLSEQSVYPSVLSSNSD